MEDENGRGREGEIEGED
jgi:hypothetical protein